MATLKHVSGASDGIPVQYIMDAKRGCIPANRRLPYF